MHSIIQQIKDFATHLCCFELYFEISILNVRGFFLCGWIVCFATLQCGFYILDLYYIYVLFFIQLWWEGGGTIVVALNEGNVPYDWKKSDNLKGNNENSLGQPHRERCSMTTFFMITYLCFGQFFIPFLAQQIHTKLLSSYRDATSPCSSPSWVKLYFYFKLSSI